MASQITLPGCPQLQHHQIKLPTGCNLHYVDNHVQQPTDGKVILLVHGWPDCWYGWRYQIVALTNAGYRVIAIDTRGMGDSRVEQGSDSLTNPEYYTYRAINEDITALLQQLSIPQIIILGHDWGGPTAWHYSRRYPWRTHAVGVLLSPYRPRKRTYMPLVDVAKKLPAFRYQLYLGYEGDKAAEEFTNNIERFVSFTMRTSDRSEHVGQWMRPEHSQFLQGVPQQVPRSKLLNDDEFNNYVNVWKKTGFRGSLNWYSTDKLNYDQEYEPGTDSESQQHVKDGFKLHRDITQNSLIITAGKDKVLSAALTEGMEAWCPQLKRKHIQEAAHWIQAEQHELVDKYLLEWIASLPPMRAGPSSASAARSKL